MTTESKTEVALYALASLLLIVPSITFGFLLPTISLTFGYIIAKFFM